MPEGLYAKIFAVRLRHEGEEIEAKENDLE